jgi:hypothetical protein
LLRLAGREKYQSAYGNKLALLERRRQTGYESRSSAIDRVQILKIAQLGFKEL